MSKKNKGKTNKNSVQQIKQKQYKRIESTICENCNTQCREYERYIQRLSSGKSGIGIVCKKD